MYKPGYTVLALGVHSCTFLFPEVVIQNFLGKRFLEPKNGICNYVINPSSLKNNRKELSFGKAFSFQPAAVLKINFVASISQGCCC